MQCQWVLPLDYRSFCLVLGDEVGILLKETARGV